MNEQERAVVEAACAYVNAPPEPAHEDPEAPGWSAMMEGLYYGLEKAVRAYQPSGPRIDQARLLTWGTVPAGWYVKAPDGKWFRVVSTYVTRAKQLVTLADAGSWHRDPHGPVTACPGPSNATDSAIEALGFPQILEDGA
jgi:hypothetical protein